MTKTNENIEIPVPIQKVIQICVTKILLYHIQGSIKDNFRRVNIMILLCDEIVIN